MKPDRRTFIKKVTGGIVGSWVLTALPACARGTYILSREMDIAPDDAEFWKSVRDQFPLSRNRAYFNNGTIGPSPYVVRDAVKGAIDSTDGSGENAGGDNSRTKIAGLVNVKESEISMTHNVTEGVNIVAWGLPLRRGDEVIITTHEHAGNALPWLNRAKLDGIILKAVVPAQTAAENLQRINDLITPATRAIAIPHITCTAGHVFPAREISQLGHDKGLWVCFDGAHAPGMIPLDLHDIGCDTYATCCHKWMCGPKGTGFLYVSEKMLDVLEARWIGAYSDLGWDVTVNPPEFKGYVPTAHRFDYGTQNAALQVGVAAAVDFLYHIGMDNIAKRGHALAGRLRSGLAAFGGKVEILTPEEERSRASMVGFRLATMPYKTFAETAAKNGFRIRQVPENHLDSIRVSTHLYNSTDEVDRFLEVVKNI